MERLELIFFNWGKGRFFIIFAFLCWSFFFQREALAQNGSFLVTQPTYAYETSSMQGQRILLGGAKAYSVRDIQRSPKGLLFQVVLLSYRNEMIGEGFILESERELQALGTKKIKLYENPPQKGGALLKYIFVPAEVVSLTGKLASSSDFPNVTWRQVTYKTTHPKAYWVLVQDGIYRAKRDVKEWNQVLTEMETEKLDASLYQKILMGFVEPSYTKQQVQWALGNPLRESSSLENFESEWIYTEKRILFVKDVVQHVLKN